MFVASVVGGARAIAGSSHRQWRRFAVGRCCKSIPSCSPCLHLAAMGHKKYAGFQFTPF